jgi:hypothetical protein
MLILPPRPRKAGFSGGQFVEKPIGERADFGNGLGMKSARGMISVEA